MGNQIADVATLSNLNNPTGRIRFALYGPGNATCAGTPRFTARVPVNGNGEYISPTFVPTQPGVYRWVAAYSGDANNAPLGPTACNDPAETVTITGTSTPVSLTTRATRGTVGAQMADVATLAGGNNPTGRLRFALYGPGDPSCSGTPLFVSAVPVNGNGEYVSSTYVPTQPGTYRWVASYSGDANNSPLGPTACGDPTETVTVT